MNKIIFVIINIKIIYKNLIVNFKKNIKLNFILYRLKLFKLCLYFYYNYRIIIYYNKNVKIIKKNMFFFILNNFHYNI